MEFDDPFKKQLPNLNHPQIDLWALPKLILTELAGIMWQWRKTPDGVYHWVIMVPALPMAEFSIPFDRLSLRSFASEILRMLDNETETTTENM